MTTQPETKDIDSIKPHKIKLFYRWVFFIPFTFLIAIILNAILVFINLPTLYSLIINTIIGISWGLFWGIKRQRYLKKNILQ